MRNTQNALRLSNLKIYFKMKCEPDLFYPVSDNQNLFIDKSKPLSHGRQVMIPIRMNWYFSALLSPLHSC